MERGSPPAGGAGGDRRYLLRPSIEVLPARGDIYLLRPGADADLAIREPDAADRLLLELLADAPQTRIELEAAMQAAGLALDAAVVEGKLDALLEADAVIAHEGAAEPLEASELARFSRQLPYLAERDEPGRAQRRLRDATVVVVGCGGLGTWTLAALASLGVGTLVLADDDRVDVSNLNRQILYSPGDVGQRKVEIAAAWVRRFDPAIAVRTEALRIAGPGDVEPLLRGADALVHAADSPPYEIERWVNTACLAAGVPWIAAAQMPPVLKVGPLYVPGRTACFACHERQLAREHELWHDVVSARMAHPVVATTLGPASGVVGTLVALQLLDLLTDADLPATAGRALLIDMRSLESRFADVALDGDCSACASLG